ncbi:helix-turn-helix domain-containing protein [Streptomyces sp. NPDC001927]
MEQHNPSIRGEALSLLRQGLTNRTVAVRLNVPRGTVGWWLSEDRRKRGVRFERPTDCPVCTRHAFDAPAYAYLLGLYLGDGHITSKRKQHHLSIFCSTSWPALIDAAEAAMRKVMPTPRVGRRVRQGCTEVKSYTKHWKCLFPQHGPGRKHERTISLEPWQQAIGVEWTHCTRNGKPYNISVARKASVALMDLRVGPKS